MIQLYAVHLYSIIILLDWWTVFVPEHWGYLLALIILVIIYSVAAVTESDLVFETLCHKDTLNIINTLKQPTSSIDSFPLQNETTSEVYVGDFGLHNSTFDRSFNEKTNSNSNIGKVASWRIKWKFYNVTKDSKPPSPRNQPQSLENSSGNYVVLLTVPYEEVSWAFISWL